MATYSYDFVGPIRPGDTREPSPGFSSADPFLARGSQQAASGSSRASAKAQAEFKAKQAREKIAKEKAAKEKAAKEKAIQEQAAAVRAAQEKLEQARGVKQREKIEKERERLISGDAKVTTKTSRDVKTGATLKITETRKGGKLIRDVKNIETGETKTTTFAPGKAGGSVGFTGGYSKTEVKQEVLTDKDVDLFSNKPSLLRIDIAKPKSNVRDIYSQSYWDATKQSGANILSNVKTFFTGRKHKYKEVLKPFDYAGTPKPEQIAIEEVDEIYYEPKFGTIAPGESGFKKVTIKSDAKTFREVQKEIETARALEPDKVKAYEKYPDVPDYFTKSGSKVKTIIPAVADIGVTTGLSIVATPLAGAGYMTFRGTQYASKGKYKDVMSGTELYPGISKMSPESKQAGLYLGFAATGGFGEVGRISKELDVLRYKAAIKAPTKTVGKLYNINNEKWLKTITRKKTPFIKEQTSIDVPLFMKGNGKFNIGVGQGKQTTSFLPFSKQVGNKGWQTVSKEFVTAGRGTTRPVILNNVLLPEKYAVTTGEGYFTFKDTRASKSFGFGGVTKDVGKAYTGKGGPITATQVYGKIGGPIEVTPKELIIPLKTSYKVPIKDTSIIFKKLPKSTDTFGLTVTKDITRKSSSKYLSQLYKQDTAVDFGSFSTSVSRGVSKTTPIVKESGVSLMAPPITTLPSSSSNIKTEQVNGNIISYSKPSMKSNIKQSSVLRIIPAVTPTSKSISKIGSKSKPITKQIPKVKSGIDNVLGMQTGQLSKQKQISQQKQIVGSVFNFPIGIPFTPTPTPGTIETPLPIILPTPKPSTKQPKGLFGVDIRRGGKFFSVGTTRDLNKAIGIGRSKVGGTLAATYRIKGLNTGVPGLTIPKNFYTKVDKDEGLLFIEKKGKRLKKGSGEIPEIISAKKRKSKRSKKK